MSPGKQMASGQLKVVLQLCVCVWGQGEGGVPHSGYDKHFVIYVYDSSLPPSNGMSRLLAAAADCFIVPPPTHRHTRTTRSVRQ